MKLLKVLVAALLLAAMVTPAIAEDRLSLYGEMRVRGHIYDYDIESGTSGNSLGSADIDDTAAWNDSRFRLGGKIAVAEGVSVHFRMDAVESNENSSDPAAWGSTDSGSAFRYTQRRGDIQFDKAYLQVEKNGFTLMAGQMYFGGFGITQAFHDSTAAGFIVKYGDLTVAHSKNSEENLGNETLQINALEGDSSTTAIQYKFKGDGFSVTPIAAYTADSTKYNQDILGLGLAFTADLGPVALKGEVDYFDGDQDGTYSAGNVFVADKRDQKGTQVFLDGSMSATDTVKVGAQLLWADSVDSDERQVTTLAQDFRTNWDFVDFVPQNLGNSDFAHNDNFDIFDPGKFYGQSGAGVIGGSIYADVKASENLAFKFGATMFETDDDKIADMDGYFLNAVASYKLAENTTLSSHVQYQSLNNDNITGNLSSPLTDEEDTSLGAITTLSVKF